MASASTISRLHRSGGQKPQIAGSWQPDAPVKIPNFGNLEIAVSAPPPERRVRSRLTGFARAETETSYTVDSASVMSLVSSVAPVDHGRFAALAAREQLERVVRRRLAARGLVGF
jgi:hypothetical protein